jgi:hypothetical protein
MAHNLNEVYEEGKNAFEEGKGGTNPYSFEHDYIYHMWWKLGWFNASAAQASRKINNRYKPED